MTGTENRPGKGSGAEKNKKGAPVGPALWVNRLIWIPVAAAGLFQFYRKEVYYKKMIVLALLMLAAVMIHWYRAGRDGQYLKRTLGLSQSRNRVYEYDWLRVLAAAMVIFTHAAQADVGGGFVEGVFAEYWMKVFYTVCMACNCIYVMLTGALLLPYREESLFSFYIRRMLRVGLPMAIYYVFYLWQNMELEQVDAGTPIWILERLYTGNTPESPHYWLIYAILSVYLVTPFLRYLTKDIPYRKLTAFVFLSWIYMYLGTFVPIPFSVSYPLNFWIGVAFMGYWVTRPETRKYDGWLMAGGLGAFAVMLVLVRQGGNFLNLSANCSPVMTAFTCGLFAFILSAKKWFGKRNRLISVIGQYSYPIILLHWWTLHWITRQRFGIHINQYFYIGGLAATLIVTLGVSWAVAFFIDNMIVLPVDAAVNGAVEAFRRGLRALNEKGRKVQKNK